MVARGALWNASIFSPNGKLHWEDVKREYIRKVSGLQIIFAYYLINAKLLCLLFLLEVPPLFTFYFFCSIVSASIQIRGCCLLQFSECVIYPSIQIRLNKNYRSTRCIVEAASSLIQNNLKRCQRKEVLTDNSTGSKVITANR